MERNVPKLRFKGFNDEWKEEKLDKLGVFFKGNGISKADLSQQGKPCILYGELYTKYSEVIDKVYSKTNLNIKNPTLSKVNDVIIPSSGETSIDIATASCVQQNDILLGGDLNVFRPNKASGIFISYQLNSAQRREIAKIAQGASVVHVYNEQLKKVKVKLPSLQEQERIANFLTKVDKIIEKQDEKVKNLEKYKKGMMQKIFSQEIRFKDENGNEYPEWEEKKLKDVVSGFEYGMNSSAIEFDGINKYIRITDIDESSNKYRNENIVSPDGILEDKYLVKENDILFARTGASVGKTYLYDKNDGKVYFAGFLIRANVNRNNNSKFIFMQTQTDEYKRWVKIMSIRSGQPGINSQEYATYNINIPCIEEQNRIAKFLTNIDDIIEKENKKLIQMRYLKKGLLQQMFV